MLSIKKILHGVCAFLLNHRRRYIDNQNNTLAHYVIPTIFNHNLFGEIKNILGKKN